MGNISSKDNKPDPSLSNVVNKIAAKYILTTNFQDLQNLKDPNYCNKIAVLTSDIIQKNLTSKEIVYLKQKTEQGKVIDKMTKDDIVYLDKNKLPGLDIQTKLQKKRVCFGIAKYYIKVAHLFSSIVGAISPEFSYIDENNIEKRIAFKDKKLIPENMKAKVKKINLCSRRINALLNNKKLDTTDENEELTIQPRFCDINVSSKINNTDPSIQTQNKVSTKLLSLIDEPGIPELETLYYDVYDYDSGEYKTMSDEAKKQYLEDVQLFYKYFTGNDKVPEDVIRFSNITLKDYHSSKGCKPGEIYNKPYKGTIKDELFKKYADHIKMMTSKASNNQKVFFRIIDQMFIFQINNETKEKDITLHPELNDEKLNELIDITRKNLIKLYTECEQDFEEGLHIFESIVESQVKDTLQNQIQDLEKRILKSVESPTDITGSSNKTDIIPNVPGLNPIETQSSSQIISHENASDQINKQIPISSTSLSQSTDSEKLEQLKKQPLNINTNIPVSNSNVPPPPKKTEFKKFNFEEENFEYQNPTEEQKERQYDEVKEKQIITDFEKNENASITINKKDGNSFFESLAVKNNLDSSLIRKEVANYLKDEYKNLKIPIDLALFNDDINTYYNYLKQDGNYITGDVEIEAASNIYKLNIEIIEFDNEQYLSSTFGDNINNKKIDLFKLLDSNTYHNIKFNQDLNIMFEDNDNEIDNMFNELINNKSDEPIEVSGPKENQIPIKELEPEISQFTSTKQIDNTKIYNKKIENFDYIKAPPNGTCLFYAIAYHIFDLEKTDLLTPEGKEPIFDVKIKDTNINCDKAFKLRELLYNFYMENYDIDSQDFNIDFKEKIFLQYYDGSENYLQTREKDESNDYISTNKPVMEWIEEINPNVERTNKCNTNIWGNMTDLHALHILLLEFYGISLIVYHKQYQRFYKSPYVYSENQLSGSEILEEHFKSLYDNNNTIFIAYTGNHYDVLEKKDSEFRFNDKVDISFS